MNPQGSQISKMSFTHCSAGGAGGQAEELAHLGVEVHLREASPSTQFNWPSSRLKGGFFICSNTFMRQASFLRDSGVEPENFRNGYRFTILSDAHRNSIAERASISSGRTPSRFTRRAVWSSSRSVSGSRAARASGSRIYRPGQPVPFRLEDKPGGFEQPLEDFRAVVVDQVVGAAVVDAAGPRVDRLPGGLRGDLPEQRVQAPFVRDGVVVELEPLPDGSQSSSSSQPEMNPQLRSRSGSRSSRAL